MERLQPDLKQNLNQKNGNGGKMMATRKEWEIALREIDSNAQILEQGIGQVVVFIEPNKLPEIAEMVWYNRSFGMFVDYLPQPQYLPNYQHIQKRGFTL